MDNLVLCKYSEGNNCIIHFNMTDIQVVYQGGAYSGVQLEPEMVVVRSYPGGRQRIQQRVRE